MKTIIGLSYIGHDSGGQKSYYRTSMGFFSVNARISLGYFRKKELGQVARGSLWHWQFVIL